MAEVLLSIFREYSIVSLQREFTQCTHSVTPFPGRCQRIHNWMTCAAADAILRDMITTIIVYVGKFRVSSVITIWHFTGDKEKGRGGRPLPNPQHRQSRTRWYTYMVCKHHQTGATPRANIAACMTNNRWNLNLWNTSSRTLYAASTMARSVCHPASGHRTSAQPTPLAVRDLDPAPPPQALGRRCSPPEPGRSSAGQPASAGGVRTPPHHSTMASAWWKT